MRSWLVALLLLCVAGAYLVRAEDSSKSEPVAEEPKVEPEPKAETTPSKPRPESGAEPEHTKPISKKSQPKTSKAESVIFKTSLEVLLCLIAARVIMF